MDYSLTIFDNAFDNRTHKRMDFQDWESFCRLLRNLSRVPRASKKDAQLISPAVYEMGTTRANRNVIDWGHWACVDVDDYTGSLEDILLRFKDNNTVVYSTASSTTDQLKFRIVFDLDRRVDAEELRHFWFALNSHLGDLGDPQTKDSSRMYYVPGDYTGSHSFYHTTRGTSLAVNQLLQKYPYSPPTGNSFLDKLPEGMREQVLQHRKDSLDRTDITWSGYSDCPFLPRQLVTDYKSIAGEGWYRKMYQIMVAVAGNAIRAGYPISAQQIANICKELDRETGNWYENRPLEREAQSALSWAYANCYEDTQ